MSMKTLERLLAGILLVVAGLIVVHAPLTVWLGTIWPDQTLYIKASESLLMGLALVLLIIIAAKRQMVGVLLSNRLMQLCLIYAGLHFVLIAVFQHGLQTAQAGLLIDLRYILYFALVYNCLLLFPQYRKAFMVTFAGGAAVVIGFALLQIFVLPKDILANIGYSKQTIAPYLTVDENPDYIRINSTLRGPNPLGAYAAIVLAMLAAIGLRWRLGRRGWLLLGLGAVATVLALNASYSRSSVIGAIVALIAIVVISVTKNMRKKIIIGVSLTAVIVIALSVVLRGSSIVINVILHDNPSTGASVDSNGGHWQSLVDGTKRLVTQPLGAGVGSGGSASLLGDSPVIIENQYLLTAHESGWIGLILFVWIFVEIMRRLWRRRQSALVLGVFGSGIGLAVVGLLLPVWTDDTVGIVWWGLAAVAIAAPMPVVKKARKNHGKRKSN